MRAKRKTHKHYMTMIGSQSRFPNATAAAPGNLLEMQSLTPMKPTESDGDGV